MIVSAPVVLGGPAPASAADGDALAWLTSAIASGSVPDEDGSTIYDLVYPSTTAVSTSFGGPSIPLCGANPLAATTPSGADAMLVVNGICASAAGQPLVDVATMAIVQGIAFGATIPISLTERPGYVDPSWDGSGWAYLAGYGVPYLCASLDDEGTARPPEIGYLVPRIWSNRAATASHNPCPYGAKVPYFNAAPVMGGTAVSYASFAHGVKVDPGGSVTIPLRLFSDADVGAWKLSVVERSDLAPDPEGVLSFALDRASGRDGDTVHLTVRRKATTTGQMAPMLAFEIVSTLGSVRHDWLVVAGTDTY